MADANVLTYLDQSPEEQEVFLRTLSDADLVALSEQMVLAQRQEAQENQLWHYRCVNPRSVDVHRSTARQVIVKGGKRSSKTDTLLAELAIQLTGIVPKSLDGIYPKAKCHPPIRARVMCESLTDTLVPIIIPKLRWDKWNGAGDPGDLGRGHWGWIPRRFLKRGSWEAAYSEKHRTLELLNGSTVQFLCLHPETGVLRDDGTYRPLESIRQGDRVFTRFGVRRVSAIHRYPDAPRVRIRLWSGPELIATPNHRHVMVDGSFRKTVDLLQGQKLWIAEPVDGRHEIAAPAWRVGWTAIMIGDGSLTGGGCPFTAVSPSRVLDHLPPLPPECILVQDKTRSDQWRIVAASGKRGPWDHPLLGALREDGLMNRRSYEKFVPPWIFRQDSPVIEAFLCHLWDTDGTGTFGQASKVAASCYTTTSRRLAEDVQRLLLRLGWSAGITSFDPGSRLCGWTSGGTPIISRRRVYRVQTSWTPGRLRGKIRSITPLDPGPVACLSVEGVGEFIANGLATGNSYDQDPEVGEGWSGHLVIHDEPPPRPWYMVNRMRTLDVKGQVFTGYTPPTEPDRAVKAAWIFDEVVCLGTPGPAKDPQVDTFTLWTEGNSILDAAAIQETVKGFSEVERRAILYGEETHLSGRVHPLFTAHEQWWCFTCNAVRIPTEGGICPDCLEKCEAFCHVGETRELPTSWPLYFVMDPHERRPCAMGWFRVTPGDDLILEQEGWVDGDVGDWKAEMDRVEKEIGREPDIRLCDPNPLDATDNRQGKGWTLRRELANHQIFVVPADDNFLVGRRRVDEYLTPDPHTRKPRLTIMRGCVRTVHAFNRYTWDEYVHREMKGPKGKPREEWKHYPDILRYAVMANPNYYISRASVMPRSTAGRSKRTGY